MVCWLPTGVASPVVEHGLQASGSVVVVHRLSCTRACGILVLRPGMEPQPPAVDVQSHNHWTTRESPYNFISQHSDINGLWEGALLNATITIFYYIL